MKIIADKNIPFAEKAFAEFGEMQLLDGRSITREKLADVSMVLVRSVTKVDAGLLEGTGVKFVATATIGTDHVDTGWLQSNLIGFASAPGSNANSVAEYIVSALLHCAKKQNRRPEELTLGIIGAGNVGSRVLKLASVLGLTCLLNDPPKQRMRQSPVFIELNELVSKSDVVTLHVPLTDDGPDRTNHLVDREFLAGMKKGAMLFNTSRGAVVSEKALREHRRKLSAVVLDVWETEPDVSPESVSLADIATPHIAGYSFDGKVTGTRMIYDAACAYYFRKKNPVLEKELDIKPTVINLSGSTDPVFDAVMEAYPIAEDDSRMRQIINKAPDTRTEFFDGLRQRYQRRLEFRHFIVKGAGKAEEKISRLGFQIG